MSTKIFGSDNWSITELKALLKRLEKTYANGLVQTTFKDQTIIFRNTSELKERMADLRDEINRREEESGEGDGSYSRYRKKVVRISTQNRGF